MAANTPLSSRGSKLDFSSIPIPAPAVTRSSQPSSPNAFGFTSPTATPQGSPSKSRFPPGAKDLPNVFDQALKLEPSSPTKIGRSQLAPHSPNRLGRQDEDQSGAGTGQENTPPSRSNVKAAGSNFAAQSRQLQYTSAKSMTSRSVGGRGLTVEEMEKLQSAKVKRMANVTQIYFLDHYFDLLNYVHQRDVRRAAFDQANPATEASAEHDTAKAKYLGRERANLRKRRTRLRHGDFHILTQIGQGGYGQVFLAQKKDTREVCALKSMSKRLLFKMDEIKHILTERDILTTSNSDWLVKLLYAFQDDTTIYLAMEYVPGGDFRTLLNNTHVLHNRHARFYIAEMVTCVDSLHQLGYIHRDLKPENFLIDGTGHVKLTDFGLASGMLSPMKIESMRVKLEEVGQGSRIPFGRPMNERSTAERREGYRSLREREGLQYAKSIVGSPDYMAPEVLAGTEYDFTVDYWSLGCMLFEAVSGYPPFAGSTVDETWQNLKDWKRVLQRPDFEGGDSQYWISDRTWDIICRLVAERGRRFRSITEIRRHGYFAEVEWDLLRTYTAPFVPELDSDTDAGYFDDFGNEEDMAKYKEVHDKAQALETMADRDESMSKNLFVGFTFRYV